MLVPNKLEITAVIKLEFELLEKILSNSTF